MSVISVFGKNHDGLSFTGKFVSGVSDRVYWQAAFKDKGMFIGNRSGVVQLRASDDAFRTVKLVLDAMKQSWRTAV